MFKSHQIFFLYLLFAVLSGLWNGLLAQASIESRPFIEPRPSQSIVLGVNRDSLMAAGLKAQNPLVLYREMVHVKVVERLTRDIQALKMRDIGLKRDWFEEAEEKAAVDSFYIATMQLVKRPERRWFLDRFREADWAGAGLSISTPLDTIRTAKLRGWLENVFGAPSSTVFDVPEERRRSEAEHVQFEYYFVVNDSIPLMVMDVYGPYQKGLVFAGDFKHEKFLPKVKKMVVEKLLSAQEITPYIDFYYDGQEDKWYNVGFDGSEYFVKEISKPRPSQTYERPSPAHPPNIRPPKNQPNLNRASPSRRNTNGMATQRSRPPKKNN